MQNTVYTIGYTAFPREEFLEKLQSLSVSCLVDVRSVPRSARYPDYNLEELKPYLEENGILYRNYAEEFGARQEDRAFYPEGYLDFELFSASPQFMRGKRRIANGVAQGQRFCLMCAEKDPAECHRCILVGRRLAEDGYDVRHILSDGMATQHDIEERLLKHYFPHRGQVSLFAEENRSDEELVREAYRLRNREIGYRPGEESV